MLAKVATLEGHCLTLTTKLGAAAKLQRLRIELRDLTPNAVYDEEQANRENDRLIRKTAVWSAIITQIKTWRRRRSGYRPRRDQVLQAISATCPPMRVYVLLRARG
jgi:hypothetical protein